MTHVYLGTVYYEGNTAETQFVYATAEAAMTGLLNIWIEDFYPLAREMWDQYYAELAQNYNYIEPLRVLVWSEYGPHFKVEASDEYTLSIIRKEVLS